MESYSKLIQRALGNGSPKEQYENLEKVIQFLEYIACPKYDSSDKYLDIEEAQKGAQQLLDELNQYRIKK